MSMILVPLWCTTMLTEDVLKAISVRQNWTLEEIRVSDVDVRNAKVGSSQRYDFRIRFGKSDLEFKFSDEVDSWRKLRRKGGFGPSIYEASSKTVLNTIDLEGPFELLVDGDDELSLLLPFSLGDSGNSTFCSDSFKLSD
ncbi:hypothetical protein BVC80_8985g50 [Macleaya cordata]|uniref:Uncharacterized protein n=1 Tax=Macleaya cordata TaxID=56857 RepID=A0A200QJ28_MACCD|nr:hypothetical protein BVC80_8985g50 [Macleaya cordata]